MQVEDNTAVLVLHRNIDIARVSFVIFEWALRRRLQLLWSLLSVRIAPYIDRETKKLVFIFWALGSTGPRQSNAFVSVCSLYFFAPFYIVDELGLRLLACKLFALITFFHEAEGIVFASLACGFGVDAEVEANVPTFGISHLPIAIYVSQLLEVEQTVLR